MNTDRLEILFVDDEQRVLDGLRRHLHSKREEWNMRFALSGAEALKMLTEQPAEIVVSDMRMPGMTGGQLMQEIQQQYPQTSRMILSGQTDQTELMSHLGCIHQYMQKPCDPLQLCQAIERTFSMTRLLGQPQLRLAASRIAALPPDSESYRALTNELSKSEANVALVADIVSRDPALTVKLMQFVNSAFFAMPRRVTSAHDAVVLLGVKTLQAIVIAHRFFEFVGAAHATAPWLTMLWKSSFEIGESAVRVAKLDGAEEKVQQQARIAGLLSLIGRAILLTSDPLTYLNVIARARETQQTLGQCEKEIFGACQDDVTAFALGLWAFPDDLVEAVAFQSTPSRMRTSRRFHPVSYLHIAKRTRSPGVDGLEDGPGLDLEYIASQNLDSLIATQWRPAA